MSPDAASIWTRLREISTLGMLRHIIEQQQEILDQLIAMEEQMTDLDNAVTELQHAVDGVAQRLLPKIDELEQALATAEEELAEALANSEGGQEAIDSMHRAADAIRAEVDRLNELGANPDTPVEPDPNQPHVDNTLPGDLPQEPQ